MGEQELAWQGLMSRKSTMKVLVACEFSGIVRDAFLAEGHDGISKATCCQRNRQGRTLSAKCGPKAQGALGFSNCASSVQVSLRK